MIRVNGRARNRPDRAGNPLDGLVNMFDVGIVLAVGFLIAALQAHGLERLITSKAKKAQSPTISLKKNQRLQPIAPGSRRVRVQSGKSLGKVYRLPDGRLVLVTGK